MSVQNILGIIKQLRKEEDFLTIIYENTDRNILASSYISELKDNILQRTVKTYVIFNDDRNGLIKNVKIITEGQINENNR